MKVFILASSPGKELSKGSWLVFETLRLGFPTADISLVINEANPAHMEAIRNAAKGHVDLIESADTIHHRWIENLLAVETEPFWICDTDVVFWANFENWQFHGALSGRRIPQFYDEFTRCITRPRLHTSLLRFDPVKVRTATDRYIAALDPTVFNPLANLIHPLCLPFKAKTYFYDTCSLLYHAIGGQALEDKHLDCYDHMNFGTLDHLVIPRLKDGMAMKAVRDKVLAQPSTLRGAWRHQEQYYAARSA